MGSWTFSPGNQTVQLTGGGFCGWTCPVDVPLEEDAVAGGWFMQLKITNDTMTEEKEGDKDRSDIGDKKHQDKDNQPKKAQEGGQE